VTVAERDQAAAEAQEEGKRLALESEEVKDIRKAVAAVAESVRKYLPAVEEVKKSEELTEAEKKVADLTQKVTSLTEKVTELTNEKAQAAAEQAKTAARKALEEKVNAVLKDYAFADQARPQLMALEGADQVDEKFAEVKGLIEQITAKAQVSGTTGTGTADVTLPPAKDKTTTEEEKLREARLAGISNA
jgi:hypothetical protein